MIITVDTNVIFSGLYSATGASHRILNLVLDEKLKLAVSTQIYFEYYDVLTRIDSLKKMHLTAAEVEEVLDLVALLSQKNAIYYLLRPNLIDETDNIFIECAFASNSDYLITSNVRDFSSGELKNMGFEIVTPGQFYQIWRGQNE